MDPDRRELLMDYVFYQHLASYNFLFSSGLIFVLLKQVVDSVFEKNQFNQIKITACLRCYTRQE